MTLDEFYEIVRNEVLDESSLLDADDNLSHSFKENIFTDIVLEDYASSGIFESPATCYHEFLKGNLIGKINGYSIPEEDTSIDLVITDYEETDDVRKINQSDVEKRLNQAVRFFEMAISDNALDSIDIGNNAHHMIYEIQAKNKEKLDHVRIHLITNAQNVARNYKIEKELKGYKVSLDVFDLERFRRFRESGSTQEKIEVNLIEFNDGKGIPCASFVHEEFYDTALVILPGILLHRLYDEFGSRLLELNVRAYLQARGKVNKGILNTILYEPEKFLTYNNGITMVAEEIHFSDDYKEIIKLTVLQIVNGGQTTASIHRALNDHNASLELVKVQAKITMVPENDFEEVVPLISKYSNTQNRISDVDLNAHHPFHLGVEKISRSMYNPDQVSKWFYERSRGSYQTEKFKAKTDAQKRKFNIENPVNQKISKEDLAKYFNTWDELPHFVSRGGQKNFVRFMENLPRDIKKDWQMPKEDYQDMIAKAIIYKTASTIARQEEIPAFRVNVVNYCLSLLVHKTASRISLKNIWLSQSVPEDIIRILKDWIPKIYKELLNIAGNKNPGEVFKKEECWKAIKENTKEWSIDLINRKNLNSNSVNNEISTESENDIARCIRVPAEDWTKMVQWGQETGKLHFSQVGIALTLFRMASSGWKKSPSEKQAKSGMKILNSYLENNPKQND